MKFLLPTGVDACRYQLTRQGIFLNRYLRSFAASPTSAFLKAEYIIHAGLRLRSVTRFLLCASFSQVE